MIDGELSRTVVPPEVRGWPVVERPVLRYHPRLPNGLILALVAHGVPVPRR